jgi:hypothetical protein
MTEESLNKIQKIVDVLFRNVSRTLLGFDPDSKRLSKKNKNLVSLFMTGLGRTTLGKEDREALRVVLKSTYDYIDVIRARTRARISSRVSDVVKDHKEREVDIPTSKIRVIVNEEISRAGSSLLNTVSAEATKLRNLSTAMKIDRMSKQKGIDDPDVFFVVTLDEATAEQPEKTLHLIPGTTIPRVWKLSEIDPGFWKKGMNRPAMLPHPMCFIGHQNIKIFTEDGGYKNIKDIKIGDRVLTHSGNFKKVLGNLHLLEKFKYKGDIVEITYRSMGTRGEQKHTLRVTPDHEFKTSRGWVKASDIKLTDKLLELFVKCGSCENLVKPRPKELKKGRNSTLNGYFCSQICSSKFQWKDSLHRKNIIKKILINF